MILVLAQLGIDPWSVVLWNLFVTVGVSIGLAYLGQALFGQDLPEAEPSEDASGRLWNPRTTQQEGLPRARCYGKNIHHGNVIAKWTDVDGNDREILYLLLEHGDGPTKGNVADQIWLNNQPVSNFGSVVVQERVGTMNQAVMTGFEKLKLEYPENAELTEADGAYTWTTPNTFFDDIEWTYCFPNGLARWKKSGSRRSTTVHFHQRIREHPAGGWSNLGDIDITAGVTTPYFKKYTASGQGFNCTRGKQYDVELTRITVDGGNRIVRDSFLRSFREVVDVAFTHPGKALTGIKAIATTKLSGSLDVKIIREDRLVNVWNGTVWNIEYSRNRAWVAYDILTQPVISGSSPYVIERYEGMDPSNMDLEFFYNWASFCDDQVLDGYGGTEDRLACDIKVDYQTNVWSIVHDIAEIGRAKPYWKGTVLTGWIDKVVSTPTDLVTMDTIMARTWQNHWVLHDELAGSVTVFYQDKNQGYERVPATKSRAAAGSYKRTISIEGIGVKTYGTATHVANHALTRNDLIRNINSFKQFKDGFRHKLGEVIRLQHKTPDWGASYRVIQYIDNNTIKLDRIFAADVGDIVYVRAYDAGGEAVELDAYTVASVSGAELTIAETWDVNPIKNNIVAIGIAGAIKLRRIIEIEPDATNYFNVTVETYVAALYDADDLDPEAPNADYIWTRPADTIAKPVTHEEVVDLINTLMPPQPDTDIPSLSNLTWTGSGGDTVAWSKTDATEDIVFTYRGTDYAITADSTTNEFIYWDPASSTSFLSTNIASVALDTGHWLMCVNEDGVPHFVAPFQIIHGAVIQAGTITASYGQIGDLAVDTLQIAGDAVHVLTNSYTDGAIGVNAAWTTIQTIVLTTTGNNVKLDFSGFVDRTFLSWGYELRVYRDNDANVIFDTDPATINVFEDLFCFTITDPSPLAALHTWYLQAYKHEVAETYNARFRSMSAIETKK